MRPGAIVIVSKAWIQSSSQTSTSAFTTSSQTSTSSFTTSSQTTTSSFATSLPFLQVSFLLEVYGQLEEPDGLSGLVQLRKGGLTAGDQILVGGSGD